MKKFCLLFLLYCSIGVLGCDCCKKLCGKKKSGEKGVQEEKSVVEKKTEWEFLKKYNTPEKRADLWKDKLIRNSCQDEDVVPAVWEQHDKKKGCVFHEAPEAAMIPIPKNINVQTMYNTIFEKAKLKSFVLYFNGDPNLKYDGTQTTLGKKFISDEDFLFYKNSEDPLLKRVVCLSYYAEKQNTKS